VEPVVLGNPAAELVRIADEHRAGLIVVGSQGLSAIERFLLGSVSERVLRHAHCSVLVVK
jgi:nucleotide-binding universal stress UspA family protein